MATFPSEFIELAAELIGDEFAAFASEAVITKNTGFDYATQTPTVTIQNKSLIRLEFKAGQYDGQRIKVGDIMLIGEFQKFDFTPSPENTSISYGATDYDLISTNIDPAGSTIIMQCRPL